MDNHRTPGNLGREYRIASSLYRQIITLSAQGKKGYWDERGKSPDTVIKKI
jgi:hypothetical protein